MEGRYSLGNFELQSAEVLKDAVLAYETHGTLNADKSNAIVYPTWYAGRHEDNRGLIGAGKAMDPEEYFIVVPDQFCNGYSSSPSNTAPPQDRMRFPLITPYDNVNAQHRLLTEHFGIEQIQMAVGFSMSGQQAFHWAARYPGMVKCAASICGTARTSPHDWLHLEGMKTALQADAAWADGDYAEQPAKGLRAFMTVTAGWFASQTFYREGRHLSMLGLTVGSMEEFLNLMVAAFGSWDANDLIGMIKTWQSADVSRHPDFGGDLAKALGSIRCPMLLMPCQTDLYFPPEDNEIEMTMLNNAQLKIIPSIYGHIAGHPGMAPAVDVEFMDQNLKQLLARR